MSGEMLFHEVEIVTCSCGHLALDHHGVDTHPRNGGCFGDGSGHPWSPKPKCACERIATQVIDVSGPSSAQKEATA